MNLQGKTALVTGASRRLGQHIAIKLATAGANIIVHARKPSPDAEKTLSIIQNLSECHTNTGSELVYHDLSDPVSTDQWFQQLINRCEGVDILINSACDYTRDTLDTIVQQDLEQAMAVQVHSPLSMMRIMKKAGRFSQVINILDARVKDTIPNHASYHLAKCVMWQLTQDLAIEYAPEIRVNAVAPGIILPPKGKGPDWLARLAVTNPLQTYGNPEDVSDAVIYLVQADFVTGQVIFIDGGRHLIRSGQTGHYM